MTIFRTAMRVLTTYKCNKLFMKVKAIRLLFICLEYINE